MYVLFLHKNSIFLVQPVGSASIIITHKTVWDILRVCYFILFEWWL